MKTSQKVGCWVGAMAIITAPLSMLLRGWVVGQLWGWFVAPTFHLPLLSIPVALGIGVLLSVIQPRYATDCQGKERTEEEQTAWLLCSYATTFFAPLWMLGVGWVIHQWV